MAKREVAFSEALKRVCMLPTREITREHADAVAAQYTQLLTTPEGKRDGAKLLTWQGFGLGEFHDNQGAYLQLPVGNGKTLISKLAGIVAGAERPYLVVPTALVDKTHREFAAYSKHWRSDVPVRIITPNELTQEPNVDYLGRLGADLYIIDECDVLMNQEGSATKRLDRDIAARNVPVLCMTGTGTRLEIQGFSHFITWALGDRAPLPSGPDELDELEAWGLAINEKTGRKKPYGVGALLDLIDLTPEEIRDALPAGAQVLSKQAEARVKFRKRVCLTPGVVIIDDDQTNVPLEIELHQADDDPLLEQHFKVLRERQRGPNGLDCADPLSYYQVDSQLGCGLTLELTPRPPEGWYEAHRNFAAFCRRKIRYSNHTSRPLDTELAVRRAFPEEDVILEWLKWKQNTPFESVPQWLSGSVVDDCAYWARNNVGLIWCQHVAFAEALAQVTGLHYYGAQGLNALGASIERADPSKTAIVSIAANLRGRNLQGWHNNLVVGWPQSARYAEQLLGRTHRYGQLLPVHVDVLLTSGLTSYAFDMCMREALFVLSTQGQRQKLLRAGIRGATSNTRAGKRWQEKEII